MGLQDVGESCVVDEQGVDGHGRVIDDDGCGLGECCDVASRTGNVSAACDAKE